MLKVWMVLAALACVVAPQDPGMAQPGQRVMGFDQEKTAHHFRLYDDGGAIEVGVRDSGDMKDRDAIRSHLRHFAMMFAAGNFDAPMLVHDSTNVPGVKVMTAKKDVIRYQYDDMTTGGRVSIFTTDPEALKAVHDFLRYQIAEHKTSDSRDPKKR